MKHLKKIMAVLLAAILISTCVLPVVGAASNSAYAQASDDAVENPVEESISKVLLKLLMKFQIREFFNTLFDWLRSLFGFAPPTPAVSNSDELNKALAAGGSFKLVDDIVLDGTWTAPERAYTGTLDGNGHSIIGLTGSNGLIGTLGAGATVKNLKLDDVNINGTGKAVGALAATASGFGTITIVDVSVSGSVKGKDYYYGGLIGSTTGFTTTVNITGCSNSATVEGGKHAGGLVGVANSNVIFTNCTNEGYVKENGEAGLGGTGGICGTVSGTVSLGVSTSVTFTNCTNTGAIEGHRVGGIAGALATIDGDSANKLTATFIGCSNEGDLNGNYDTGVDYEEICGTKWNENGASTGNLTIIVIK